MESAYDYLKAVRIIAQSVPEQGAINETPSQYIARLNSALNFIVDHVIDYERMIVKEEHHERITD